jgi:hypothetical protein
VVCVVVLGEVVVELDEDAALANAAPPPATAPVTTKVTSMGLIRCRMFFHLLASTEHRMRPLCRSDVGSR